MSVFELVGELAQWLANSPGAPGGPAPVSGPAAGPALGGGGGGGGKSGRGGPAPGGPNGPPPPQNGPSDGPPQKDDPPGLGDLWESGKDAVKELMDIGEEVGEIATSDDRTADEEIVWGEAGTDPEDVVLDNVPGVDKVRAVEKAGKAGYQGRKNVNKYISRRHRIMESINDGSYGHGDSGDSGDSE